MRPGEVKTIQITGLDQFNNPTYFVVRILDEDKSLGSTLSKLFDVNSSFQPPENYSEVYKQKVYRNEEQSLMHTRALTD